MGLFYYAQKKKREDKKGNTLNSKFFLNIYTFEELLSDFNKRKSGEVYLYSFRSNDIISTLTGGKISASTKGFICKQGSDMLDIVAHCGPYESLMFGRLEISKNTFSYKSCNLGAVEKVEITNSTLI